MSILALSDAAQLALIVAIAPTIASMGALFVSLSNHIKSKENGVKADTIIQKATEIHTVTNSNLSEVRSELRTALEKILGLERLLSSKKAEEVQDVKVVNTTTESVPVKQGRGKTG